MGVSPVLASIIMISITLAGGITIWNYVNTTSAEVQEAYGRDVVSDINKLNEDFIATHLGLNATGDKVTLWIYNNGAMDTQIEQVLIWSLSNATAADLQITPLTLPKGAMGNLNATHTIDSGETYYVMAVAQYGSTYTIYGKAN